MIKVKKMESASNTSFIPNQNLTNLTFKPETNVGIKVDKVFKNLTVKMKFNIPMELYINPLFTENSNRSTNVTKVLSSYL